jgi:hypothetical protein
VRDYIRFGRWSPKFCWFISIRESGSIQCTSHPITSQTVRYHCSLRTSSAQSAEVLGRLGDDITTEFHNDATSGLSTDGDVEINLRERPALERTKESLQGQQDTHKAKEKIGTIEQLWDRPNENTTIEVESIVTTRMTLHRSGHCASCKPSFDPGQTLSIVDNCRYICNRCFQDTSLLSRHLTSTYMLLACEGLRRKSESFCAFGRGSWCRINGPLRRLWKIGGLPFRVKNRDGISRLAMRSRSLCCSFVCMQHK